MSHNIKKNYDVCDECGEKNIKINDRRCIYDFIIKNRCENINRNENIKWDNQCKNVIDVIKMENFIIIIGAATFDNIINRIKYINKYGKNIKLIIVGDCMQLPPVEKCNIWLLFQWW